MRASIVLMFLIMAVGYGSTANLTIYIENAQYKGHYLAGNSIPASPTYFRNPPLINDHKWMVDWDLIFLSKGEHIAWVPNGNQLYNAVRDNNRSPVVSQPVATQNWKMTYTTIGSQTYYRFLVMAGGEDPLGCLWDNGTLPLVTAVSNCTDNNLRTLWQVYIA